MGYILDLILILIRAFLKMTSIRSCTNERNLQREPDLPWNASRCNRLLRPLASKLAALKKSTTTSAVTRGQVEPPFKSATLPDPAQTLPGRNSGPEDPAWTTANPNPRPKRKYGHRNLVLSEVTPDEVPTDRECRQIRDISLPTPFLRKTRVARVGKDVTPGAPSNDSSDSEAGASLPVSKRRHLCGASISAGAVQAFFHVIEATEEGSTRLSQHSLFSMCLRRVPQFIKSESQIRKRCDRDDKSDPAEETYDLLEGLGTSELLGWHGLRAVVRAHGISLMRDAINANLFNIDEIETIKNCCKTAAVADVWHDLSNDIACLTKCMAASRSSNDNPIDGLSLPPAIFNSGYLVPQSNDPSLHFARVEKLVLARLMPASCLATPRFNSFWNDAKRSITCQDEHHHAASSLVEKCLLLSAGVDPTCSHQPPTMKTTRARKQYATFLSDYCSIFPGNEPTFDFSLKPTQNNFLGICTVLSAASIVANASAASASAFQLEDLTRAVRGAAIDIMRAYQLNAVLALAITSDVAPMAASILAADIFVLIHGIGFQTMKTRNQLIRHRVAQLTRLCTRNQNCPHASLNLDVPAKLVSAIALCCDMALPGSGFQILKHFIDYLMTHSSPIPAEASLARGLALQSALSFEDETTNPFHAAHASKVVAELGSNGTLMQVFGKQDGEATKTLVPRGFRWEQGICEWIAATPVAWPVPRQGITINTGAEVSPLQRNNRSKRLKVEESSKHRTKICQSYTGQKAKPRPSSEDTVLYEVTRPLEHNEDPEEEEDDDDVDELSLGQLGGLRVGNANLAGRVPLGSVSLKNKGRLQSQL